ncbi:MAG: ABC transporter permease [Planctomycetota bacterium]
MNNAKTRALFNTAIRSLLMHRLRSLLTVLGLVFGVASVIIMLAVAEGASEEAQRQIESLGVLNIIVRSQKPLEEEQNDDRAWVVEYGLTYSDLRRINNTVKTARLITPMREFVQTVRRHADAMDTAILGVEANYDELNRLTLSQGRFVESADLKYRRNICVIGADVARDLFGYEDPINQSIRIGPEHFFRVIGVAKWRTPSAGVGSSLSAQDFNKYIYVPITTDRARFGEVLYRRQQGQFSAEKLELSQITVEVDETQNVQQTSKILESLLASVHDKQDYAVVVPLDLLEQSRKTQQIFRYVLGSVAAISLLVGGIGIMNIMLATVSERQREIGIRRALGANRSDIVTQFLIETVVLSSVGAAIGVALGLTVPSFVSWASELPTKITWWSPLIATTFALGTGIIFGIYPARQAANMDPIEALRSV